MEGSHKEGESQEVQVGINKDSFNLVSILFCKTCNTQKYSLIACVCVCVCVWGGGGYKHTKLLQRVNSILHVDPEPKPPKRDGIIGDGQGELSGGTVNLLHTHTHAHTHTLWT